MFLFSDRTRDQWRRMGGGAGSRRGLRVAASPAPVSVECRGMRGEQGPVEWNTGKLLKYAERIAEYILNWAGTEDLFGGRSM